MKKSGFTLAELIITLSIIGVAAALAAPALTNMVPDKHKIKVINCHTRLGNAISDILNDDTLYHPYTGYRLTEGSDETVHFLTIDGTNECAGLSCVTGDVSTHIKTKVSNNTEVWTIPALSEDGLRILVDIDKKKTGCSFAASDCTFAKVDTYVFKVDKYGAITAGDVVTDAYLRNPLNMNDRKTDRAYVKANRTKKY